MNKAILLAAAAAVGTTTVAAYYYTSPVGVVAAETPAILVDLPPDEVVRKIRTITMDTYLLHAGADSAKVREEAGLYVQLRAPRAISATETQFDLMRGDDHLMQFKVIVKPVKGGKSEVDVQTLIGDSRFSKHRSLHPYDLELLLAGADFLATDYVSSILKGHPMLMGQRLEKEMEKRFARDADVAQASLKRMQNAFFVTYAEQLKEDAGNMFDMASDALTEADDGGDADYAAFQAESAANAAAAAADQIASDAADAADAAEDSGW